MRRLVNQFRRTLRAFVPALARPDDAWAKGRLEPAEYILYRAMDPRDRAHACEVAWAVLGLEPDPRLVRAALLHDLGKAERPFNPFERILVHLHAPAELPPEPRFFGLRGAWQIKLHHARYGAERLRAAGGCEAVAEIVARHHQPDGHPLAALLKRVEERY